VSWNELELTWPSLLGWIVARSARNLLICNLVDAKPSWTQLCAVLSLTLEALNYP